MEAVETRMTTQETNIEYIYPDGPIGFIYTSEQWNWNKFSAKKEEESDFFALDINDQGGYLFTRDDVLAIADHLYNIAYQEPDGSYWDE